MNQDGNTQNSIDYNLEETGKLLTQSKPEGKKKRIIIIAAVALIAVVLIGIFGIRALNDKRYNDKVAVAEKAMQEGDYAQAEAAYLEASEMNKREPKAREGLAYAYAMQDKFEEAQKEYESLYKDTGDEKYQVAAQDVTESRLPLDSSIAVATAWREISLDEAPYADYFLNFVNSTIRLDTHDILFEANGKMSDEGMLVIFETAMSGWSTGAAEDYVEDAYETADDYENFAYGDDADPRSWYSGGDGEVYYDRADKSRVDNDLKQFFNCTDDQIGKINEYGERSRSFYTEDGYYYYDAWLGNRKASPESAVEVMNIRTNGVKYCVQIDDGTGESLDGDYDHDQVDHSKKYLSYYEMLEFKAMNGKHYLTMSYYGPEMPEEVKITGMPKDGKDEKDKNDSEELKNRITGVWGAMSEEYHFNEDGSFYVPSPELNIGTDGEDLPDIEGKWYVDNGAIYVEFNDKKIKYTYDADNDLLMDEYGTSLSRVN